jgi:hypothetical protein
VPNYDEAKIIKKWGIVFANRLILRCIPISGLFLQELGGILQAWNLLYNSLEDSINHVNGLFPIFVTGRMKQNFLWPRRD